ncbi:inner membrane protein [Volucribacter psittacicida]|uniref:Inner membrane protein n=1 Tax=Volucribacter psittacicida TaxID=203482 RepID=A0A4R1FU67_9PAST|nr:YgjV family protein [Volucribacter psittacicida]TCJ98876.1 inner membrane protein [Volucribacter psittacicida]
MATFWQDPIDYVVNLPLAQWLGIVAFLLGILVFWQRNDRKLKIYMVLLGIIYTLHFFLLDAQISALTSFISSCRTFLSIFVCSPYVAFSFVAIMIAIGGYSATSFLSLLPIIGSTSGTLALFLLSGIKMRLLMLMGSLCWLINNILIGSIGGVLLELTVMSVNVLTIVRMVRCRHIA